jgi:curved DNA-binding protein CbpA
MKAPPTTDGAGVKLLAESAGAGSSGILTALRGKHRRLICLDGGRIVFVGSNVIEEQFEEELVRKQILDTEQRALAKGFAAQEKKKLTSVLLEQKMVEPSDLTRARERHVRALVLSTLEWDDAEFGFQLGRPNLEGELLVSLSCVPLVLEHARHHPATVDQVRVRIGPPNFRPVATERAAELLEGVALGETARSLLEACDGTRDLSVLLSQTKHSAEELLRPLYAFMLLGMVQTAAEDKKTRKKVLAPVTRDECLARLGLAHGADHYMVLGVDSKATPNQIREAYYLLARRYHPDRFSTGPLADLRPDIEVYFTQVTEAHNTLADPELRKQYDEQRLSTLAKKEDEKQDTAYLARENYARAKVLLDKKRLQDAVRFLENAIQLDESKSEYHLELGRVLTLNPRRRADAERHLQRATEINPTAAVGYVELGRLYAKMGRRDDAASAFREALRWEPEDAAAQRELANLG